MSLDKRAHWENVFATKQETEVSWYQQKPETSINFFTENNISKDAKIIDIGGGDSYLVDYLLELGYQDISVLDISKYALDRAKQRLGDKAKNVKWIEANAAHFQPVEKYDFWHDRATFHFLTEHEDIENYIKTANESIAVNGVLIIGTFSENGPKKCSGIDIKQYSEKSLQKVFLPFFEKINCFTTDHNTPFNTVQNFTFCSFRKK